MQLGIVEIFAAILIAISLVKIVVVTFNWRLWIRLMKGLYAKPKVVSVVSLILAVGVLFALLSSGLTIIDILAVCFFLVLIFLVGIAPYAGHVVSWAERQDLSSIFKDQWLYIVVWGLLLVWGIVELVAS